MNRILIVDPDPACIAHMREVMSTLSGWDAAYAGGSQQALHALGTARFDLVICEMDLGAGDGAELLGQIRLHHPAVIRVLMTDPVEGPQFDRAVENAQRLLTKPATAPDLKVLLDGLVATQARARNPLVRTVVGRVSLLPSSTGLLSRLDSLLAHPEGASLHEVADLVSQDPGLSTKILQIVNSAWFGMRSRVVSLHQAVALMGLTALRALLLLTQVLSSARGVTAIGFSMDRTQQNAVLTARLARSLLDEAGERDAAFTAGLLHDIGVLVLAAGMQSRYALTLRHAGRSNRPLVDVELSFIGTSHTDVGAYLADLWGLPEVIVQGIEHHHDAQPGAGRHAAVIDAVRIAQQVARDVGNGVPLKSMHGLTDPQKLRLGRELAAMGLESAPTEAPAEATC